jgi:cytochrome c peroxidase
MRRWGILVGIAVVAAAVLAPAALLLAGGEEELSEGPHGVADLSEEERNEILLAAEQATASKTQQELVREGEELFNSTELAKAGESCNTCHTNGGAAPDLGTIVHGTDGAPDDFLGPRDPPALYDLERTAPYGWAGQFPTIKDFAADAVVNHFVDPCDEQVLGDRTAALEAYLETIRPPQTDFDLGTLSPAALRGEEIFQGKGGCIGCHGGPQFTDNALHDLGVPQLNVSGLGLADDPGAVPEMPGAFNTPQLRDVRNTAPYFHNGFAENLRDLVQFYNNQATGVAPLNLTPAERADLIEYLESL